MMNNKSMRLPIIILLIGILAAAVACLFTCVRQEPLIKAHDFPYSITYRLDGEVKTHSGVYKCSFYGFGVGGDDPTLRDYIGEYTLDGVEEASSSNVVAKKDGVSLYLRFLLDEEYLMGDPYKYSDGPRGVEPYLEAVDEEWMLVELSDVFDAEIISWDFPEPIENSFRFAGFSVASIISMFAMILVGVLTILACMIFVRRDSGVAYTLRDRLSAVFNFFMIFLVIPVLVFYIWILPIVMDSEGLLYQIYLFVPVLSTFAVAASVALRRKGFSKSGLIVQFVCPGLFLIWSILDSVIYYLFM